VSSGGATDGVRLRTLIFGFWQISVTSTLPIS
jgi:hypothetical protein